MPSKRKKNRFPLLRMRFYRQMLHKFPWLRKKSLASHKGQTEKTEQLEKKARGGVIPIDSIWTNISSNTVSWWQLLVQSTYRSTELGGGETCTYIGRRCLKMRMSGFTLATLSLVFEIISVKIRHQPRLKIISTNKQIARFEKNGAQTHQSYRKTTFE